MGYFSLMFGNISTFPRKTLAYNHFLLRRASNASFSVQDLLARDRCLFPCIFIVSLLVIIPVLIGLLLGVMLGPDL